MPDNDLAMLFEQFGQYSEQVNVILTDTAKRRIFTGELDLQGPIEMDGEELWAAPFQSFRVQILHIEGTDPDSLLTFRVGFGDGDGTELAYFDQKIRYGESLTILPTSKFGISGWFTVKHD